MSPTSVTNIKIQEALRLTLSKAFAFFDISCRNDPTASQRKIMKIISVRYFTAIFKKPFTKLIEFFRLLILKSFKNLHFLFKHIFHQNRKYFRTTLRLESTFIARASSLFLKLMIQCQSYTKVLYDIFTCSGESSFISVTCWFSLHINICDSALLTSLRFELIDLGEGRKSKFE